ncbi:MAG: hypothetical protein J2P37_19205 [Ktedonobacteraceae bacterium]|nr:hypothetical protein [Ktedonobacteraceae bacterium]MBO0795776.1 hypothetical protein [Ktedonobacteraceae bacterium]
MYQDPRDAYRQARRAQRAAWHAQRAAWRANRRNYRYLYRGSIYGRHLPIRIFLLSGFILFFVITHQWYWLILIAIGLVLVIQSIISRVLSMSYQWPQQQPLYQQPETPPYQSDAPSSQPQYQPYDQGYQPSQKTYQEGNQEYPYPVQPEYDRYEEPQAQYPEQMPPMQQQ